MKVELPDGRIAEFPESMGRDEVLAVLREKFPMQTPDGRSTAPGTTAEQAGNIPPGMIYDERTGGYVDTAAEAQRMGKGFGAAANFGSGMVFGGEGLDEAAGYIGEKTRGVPREIGQEVVRQSREQFQESNPGSAVALEIGGAVASAIPYAMSGAGVVGAVRGPAQKAVAAAVGGAAAGGLEGASQGYLAGRGRNRARTSRERATLGAGIGAAAGPGGLALGALGKNAIERLKKSDVGVIAEALGVDKRAAALIKRYLVNDDLDRAQALLARGGDDAMLADAGMGTAAALDTAAQTGGAPLRIAREAVDTRANAAGAALTRRLDDVLGAADGRRAATRAVGQRTAAARQTAYGRAYAAPIDYAADTGRNVEAVLERIAPKRMQAAIEEANDAMRDAGVKNTQIVAEIGDDGAVVFREMPNVQQLDYLKRALDDIARGETDSITGQMTDGARRAASQAEALRDALGEAVPEYKAALRLGGDTIAERNALDMGVNLLSERVTVEDVRDAMRGASAAQKAAIRQGLRQNLEQRMGAVRATLTDDAVEARQAVRATLDVSSDNAKRKIALALGPDAKAFREAMDEASAALELRAAMASNSKTAIRTAGREAVDEVVEPNALESLLRLEPGKAASKTASALTGMGDLTAERREAVLSQVATALTQIRGRPAQQALRTVRKALEGQPINEAQARQVGKVVGGASFIGAFEAGQQTLSQR